MIIRTLPFNYIIKGKQNLDVQSNSIGSNTIEKIINNELSRVTNAQNESTESLKQKIFGVQLKFGSFEFDYLKGSSDLMRLLKDANSISLTYAYFYFQNKFTLYSREIHYNNDKFPVMSFFNMEKSRTHYDIKNFAYREDFYKAKVVFKQGNIVHNVLDNRDYFLAKDPSQYSVFESLIPIDPELSNKYCISSYASLSLVNSTVYNNIQEYCNERALEKFKGE